MEKKKYPIVDIAKLISAFLVIAIHCAPFIQVDETLNFVFVQIIARLGVPFFFITSGFLFFRKIDVKRGWRDKENIHHLKQYGKRIFKIYILWSILYLPLLMLGWLQGGFDSTTLPRLLRDFLFSGTYYHLWFLPALLVSIPLVYGLYMNLKRNYVLLIVMVLYAIGVGINVYGDQLQEVTMLKTMIQNYEAIFITARNGLFFGPVFVTLGIYAREFEFQKYIMQSLCAFVVSFVLLCVECFMLFENGIMKDLTSMYGMLIPTIFFLFILLLQVPCKEFRFTKTLRQMSLLIYVSHMYFVVFFLQFLNLSNIMVYILSILCSCLGSYLVLKLSDKIPFVKNLY